MRPIALIALSLMFVLVACGTQPESVVLPTDAQPTDAATSTPTDAPTPTDAATLTDAPTAAPSETPLPRREMVMPGEGDALLLAVSSAPGSVDAPADFAPGDIYVIGSAGTSAQITVDPANDTYPVWAVGGERLYFVSDREGTPYIYTANLRDTSPPQRLAAFDQGDQRDPAPDPTGVDLAFTSNRGGNDDIYVMATNGRNVRQLTTNAAPDYQPHWSPDKTWMAFTSERDGSPDIYVMAINGEQVTRLTDHPGVDQHPVFSPDGRRIVFISDRDRGVPQVFMMNLPVQNVAADIGGAAVDLSAVEIPPLNLDVNAPPPPALQITSDAAPKTSARWYVDTAENSARLVFASVLASENGDLHQVYLASNDGSRIDPIGGFGLSLTAPAVRP